jgi:hypothetical protein
MWYSHVGASLSGYFFSKTFFDPQNAAYHPFFAGE